jgi:transcriptional regulator with XRE-family HTH domain
MITLEDRLVHTRKKAGYTQKELAEALGITARTVQRYEKDASCLTINIATELSSLCKVDLIWLITGNNPSDSSNLTKVIIEHQELVARFKNPEKAKEINERLIEIEELSEAIYDKVSLYIEASHDAAKAVSDLKKTSKDGEDIQDNRTG